MNDEDLFWIVDGFEHHLREMVELKGQKLIAEGRYLDAVELFDMHDMEIEAQKAMEDYADNLFNAREFWKKNADPKPIFEEIVSMYVRAGAFKNVQEIKEMCG